MNTHRPIIIFDTSAINRLADDPDFDALFGGIKTGYFVRVTGTVIAELVAVKSSERRKQLFEFERKLRTKGEILLPFAEIISASIKSFEKNAADFDCHKIPVTFREAESYLGRNLPHDEISTTQRKQAEALEDQFIDIFRQMQVGFDKLFLERSGKAIGEGSESVEVLVRPPLEEMLSGLMRDGGSMWIWGQMLYKRDDPINADVKTVRQFYDLCPAFRALLVALCVLQYERCIRDIRKGDSFRAGRVDTLMASHLPYCNRFVSDDPRQVNLLKQVVIHANLPETSVLSYSDFRSSLIGMT